jgi:hypothetical protein
MVWKKESNALLFYSCIEFGFNHFKKQTLYDISAFFKCRRMCGGDPEVKKKRRVFHVLLEMDIITPNYVYYNIIQLILRYEYSTILILHKT